MNYENIIFEEAGDLARITLNRPKVVNALSVAMSGELFDAIERVRASNTIKYLVIKGAGGNFCSGDDLTEMLTKWGGSIDTMMKRVRVYQDMANTLEDLDAITICAVDGFCVGGGLEVAMACDFVVATEQAKWGMPEIDWGIVPGWGGTARMTRYIGRRKTKEINFLGALHPAKYAVELGLYNRVVPNGTLETEIEKLLTVLRTKSSYSLRHLKFIINKGVDQPQQTALAFEALNAAVSAAAIGVTSMDGADQGRSLKNFKAKKQDEILSKRRDMATNFWVD
jgi:enoyl-CoA hydratase